MADKARIFTIQPRFKLGDNPIGWAMVDGLFHFGEGIPPYGTEFRDMYLAELWQAEPMTAGVFNTWVEKAQTVNWTVTGGRNQANYYAKLLHDADGGEGWSYHEGVCALDYLTTDKGALEELGRDSLTPEVLAELKKYYDIVRYGDMNDINWKILTKLIEHATFGKVTGIQHLDATRMMRVGLPGMRWRYYPDFGNPTLVPDDNMIQLTAMPTSRDRFRGLGYCAMTRLLDAKQLMLGYLNYYRQEIGDLPPELVAIINGLSASTVEDSLRKYKEDKKNKGHDEYGKIWWLGNDDPSTPVSFTTTPLTSPTKSFNYQMMVEWWIKLLALNTGEDVGEFWLLQSGESKTVQSIQAMKSQGKGVAKYMQEKERRYNLDIMPFGVKFEYDNPYDENDAQKADILAKNISSLNTLASMGVDRQEPVFTVEELRQMALKWDVIPLELTTEEVPATIGAVLKQLSEETYSVDMNLAERIHKPLLTSDKDIRQANYVYNVLKDAYDVNHKVVEEDYVNL